MTGIKDYASSLADSASRKFGTFSYLPPLEGERLRAQIEYIVSKGYNPAVEHTEPANAFAHYWYMWKLPLFGEKDVDRILAEIEACRSAHPNNHVRLVGYDNRTQTRGAEMVVHRGKV